ncbi:MAG: 3-deoxy-manno-octulosonate-8-phosphatase KdsC [Kangiella sp.]|nr:MAG: 3-deoxy-manno-octulosonate-8-phosphatase KdsC [Kangiella sp.]
MTDLIKKSLANLAQNYSQDLLNKAKAIKLVICDVDGVLSNGKVYFGNENEELKSFNIKDGLGIKQLLNNGIQVAIITGRESNIVSRRSKELGISHVYQGKKDKIASYDEILVSLNLKPDQVAHVGDDLPDIPLMNRSGLGICVSDAHFFVKQNADWSTSSIGGDGAVREISDLLLYSQGKLQSILENYLS